MTGDHNPFAPPAARVADIAVEEGGAFQPVRIFSLKGRTGRLRYLIWLAGGYLTAYTGWLVLTILSWPILGFASWEQTRLLVMALAAAPYLVFCIAAGVQRSHDMNLSGWAALLTLIPPVALGWMLAPGTPAANRFGPPPPPHGAGEKILAWALPVLAFLVIVANLASS
jgi:uncharacterized membrane protein YhaH (DUF805 family)